MSWNLQLADAPISSTFCTSGWSTAGHLLKGAQLSEVAVRDCVLRLCIALQMHTASSIGTTGEAHGAHHQFHVYTESLTLDMRV